jgi:hypothetical protein
MKLNLQNWDRKPVKFYCDGIEIERVVEADDVEGYLDFLEVDKNGHGIIINDEVSIKRIHGMVLIDLMENKQNEVPDSE